MVVFSADGSRIVSASDDGIRSGMLAIPKPPLSLGVMTRVLLLFFRWIATGHGPTGRRASGLCKLGCAFNFSGQKARVVVAFSADGVKLASAGKDQVRVGCPEFCRRARVIGASPALPVFLRRSPTRCVFSDCDWRLPVKTRSLCLIFAARQRSRFCCLVLRTARFGSITSILHIRRTARLASASRDNTVRVWDSHPDCNRRASGQQGAVAALASRDGTHDLRRLIAVSGNGT
jgi:hypothetical protein